MPLDEAQVEGECTKEEDGDNDEWETEEADIEEGEAHTVYPNDSDGEEENHTTTEGETHTTTDTAEFREYLRTLNESKKSYETNIISGTCTCPDRVVVGFICKHLFRSLQESGKDMSALPKSVTEAPHLTVDHEVLKMDRNVMQDVVERNLEVDVEPIDACMGDVEEGKAGVHHRSEFFEDINPLDVERANEEEGDPSIDPRETERALNNVIGHLKVLTSLAHKGTLKPELILKFEEGARALRDEMTASEKSTINEEFDFAQVGTKRKRTVSTEHGVNADQTLLPRKPADEFPKKKSKGRPKCKKETLPRTDFGVDWEEIAKSNGMD